SMEERMTLANMVIEAGGKNGIIACDETTRAYLRGRTTKPLMPVENDAGARFLAEKRYDARRLEPTVAKPHSPDNRPLARELKDAGCPVSLGASCAACLGGPGDTFGRINGPAVCISTARRNCPGRMGAREGQVYLASPYTVAASAVTGRITDPRELLQ